MQSNGPLFDSLDFDICGQDHCPKNSFFFFFGDAGEMRLRIPHSVEKRTGLWDSPYLTGPIH